MYFLRGKKKLNWDLTIEEIRINLESNLTKKANSLYKILPFLSSFDFKNELSKLKDRSFIKTLVLSSVLLFLVFSLFNKKSIPNNLSSTFSSESNQTYAQEKNEVFGFAPYWNIDKLNNVDFNTLTTLAYFGVIIDGNGNIVKDDPGYTTFESQKATNLFTKAHQNGTRVVLTMVQMQNQEIENLMDSPDAQNNAISQVISEVKGRGIDGVNVDFEYQGDPGQTYRDEFSQFVKNLTDRIHQEVPDSKVTVSVYASAVKEPKIYDIGKLSQNSDGIFMMAYDFANTQSQNAIPTAPLYGYKQGKYWYDISTAVDDFLTVMPSDKLILGVPWYGYNYPVYTPQIEAQTISSYYWGETAVAQTYENAKDNIQPNEVSNYTTGWDNLGEVGWKAYFDQATYTWRMIFLDDSKSLGLKYDFAKEKNLAGVGIWALGFDNGSNELWKLLQEKFGQKIADINISKKPINTNI